MSPSKYIFTLDLRTVQSQMSLPVTQGDTNRTLVISFSDGGKPFVLGSGASAMISIVRPTGTSVQEFCLIEDDGARVVYNFSEHTCAVSGLHKCQIVLYNSEGKQIASPKFAINASPKLIDGDDLIIPDEDITAIDAIYLAEAQRQAAESEREEAEEARENAEELRETNTQAAITKINEVKASIETMRDNGEFKGESAYEIAVKHGYKGTEEQWDKEARGDFSERLEDAKQEVSDTVKETNEEYLGYIDELIGDGSESVGVILPETAEPGQFLRVTSVAKNGRITALEAVTISLPIPLSQEEYDAYKAEGILDKDALYLIVEEDSI